MAGIVDTVNLAKDSVYKASVLCEFKRTAGCRSANRYFI